MRIASQYFGKLIYQCEIFSQQFCTFCSEQETISLKPYIRLHACSVASVVPDSSQPYELQPSKLFCPWDSPGKNSGVCCHPPPGIFPTQRLNLGLRRLLHLERGFFTTSTTWEALSHIQGLPLPSCVSLDRLFKSSEFLFFICKVRVLMPAYQRFKSDLTYKLFNLNK